MPNKPAPLALHQIDGLARSLLPMFDGTRPMMPSDKANIETLVRAIPDLVREILDLTACLIVPNAKEQPMKLHRDIVITPEFVQDCVDAGVGEAVLKELDTPSDSLAR